MIAPEPENIGRSTNSFESILQAIKNNNPKEASNIDLSDIELDYEQLQVLHTAVQRNTTVGYIRWGELPQGDNASELVAAIEHKIAENNKNYQYFPTDYIYGLLSSHSYSDAKSGDRVEFKNTELNKYVLDWEVHKVYNETQVNGYYAAIYINKKACQVVLAHRGSEFNKLGELLRLNKESDWTAGFRGVLGGMIVSQQAYAYQATKKGVKIAKALGYCFSITGHSLGAWLAENGVFFCHKDFSYPEVKAVTFDSPGSLPMWEKFQSNVVNYENKFEAEQLNIVTYLSVPNVINCCNGHIGKVYRLFPNITFPSWMKRVAKLSLVKGAYSGVGHMLESYILPEFNPETGVPREYEEVLDWPRVQYKYVPQKHQVLKGMVGVADYFLPASVKPLIELGKNIIDLLCPDHSIIAITDFIMDLVEDKIDQTQYWEAFKYIEPTDGYKEKENMTDREKFYLTYKGHYKTAKLNGKHYLYKELTPDRYLIRLKQCLDSLKRDRYICENVRVQLETTTALYSIDTENNRFYLELKEEAEISIQELKQWVRRIIEVTPKQELKGKLFNLSKYPSGYKLWRIEDTKHGMIPSDIPYDRKQLEGREVIFTQIDNMIKNEQVIVISGFAGVGKSSIALEYGYRAEKKNIPVRWFKAGTKDKLDISYHKLATDLKIDTTQGIDYIIRHINHELKTSGEAVFIFDNVEKQSEEEIQGYIRNLPTNIKLIITTRAPRLSNDYETIKVEPLRLEQSVSYLKEMLKINEEEANKLARVVGVIPPRLSLAMEYLRSNPILTAEEFILKIHNDKSADAVTQLILEQVVNQNKSWELLQYIAYLDPDYIPLSIFENLFGDNIIRLQEVIAPLEELSLIEVTADRKGLKIHRVIQEEIRKYRKLNQDKSLETSRIMVDVISRIDELLPNVNNNPDSKWKEADKFAIHATKIISHYNELSKESAQAASIMSKLGNYYQEVKNNFKVAADYHNKALEMYKRVHQNQDHPDVALSLNNAGVMYFRSGEGIRGLEYWQQAIDMRLRIYPNQRDPAAAAALAASFNSIGASWELRYTAEGLKYLEKALKMVRMLYPNQDDPAAAALAVSLNNLGAVYEESGDLKKVLECFEQALKMVQKLYPNQDRPVATVVLAVSLNNLGTAYEKSGDLKKGLEYFEKALKMVQELYPNRDHPNVALSLNNVGVMYLRLGEVRGLKYCAQALEMRERIYPNQRDPATTAAFAASLNSLGAAYWRSGYLEYFEQALKVIRMLYPNQDHPDAASALAASLNNLGAAYEESGDLKKGLEYFEQALKMVRKLYPNQDRPDVALSLNGVGFVYYKLGDLAQGLKYKEQALEMRWRLYPDQAHPDVALSLNKIGLSYGKLGDENKALEYFKQAYSIWAKNYNLENPYLKLAEKNVETLQSDFFTRKAASFTDSLVAKSGLKVGNEYRVIIRNRGEFKEDTLEIKLKLQSGTLNKIQQCAHDGRWTYKYFFKYDLGVKGYLEDSHLKKQLGRLGDREENLVMAKMLCFEAMNLGIMKSAKKNYGVATEFAKAYKELVKEIAAQHPEYFVDGSIVEACIRAFPHDRKWKEHLLKSTGIEERKSCSRPVGK